MAWCRRICVILVMISAMVLKIGGFLFAPTTRATTRIRSDYSFLSVREYRYSVLRMALGDDGGESPKKKSVRKKKADKIAELVSQGMREEDATSMVAAQSTGTSRKSKSKREGKSKAKMMKADERKLEDSTSGYEIPNGSETGAPAASTLEGLDLDADLAALEAKWGDIEDTNFNLEISDDSRSALEAISEEDLREVIQGVQAGGGHGGVMEGMDDFLKMVKSGDAEARMNAGGDLAALGGMEGGADADSFLPASKAVVTTPTAPPKKRRGRPPSKRTPYGASVANTAVVGSSVASTTGGDETSVELEVEPPPLEEFKRLMDSLGPDNIFEEDDEDGSMWNGEEQKLSELSDEELDELVAEIKAEIAEDDAPIPLSVAQKGWYPKIYKGGKPEREPANPAGPPGTFERNTKNVGIMKAKDMEMLQIQTAKDRYSLPADEPSEWRVQIVSVVTNSSRNSTALDMVNKVYDVIREGTNNDPRIKYQTVCYSFADDEPFDELEDNVQMWLESYNTYHLIDGAAMKEVWGAIMPHIILGDNNLAAIIRQVKWALDEDTMGGAMLTPRLRRVRLRGGAAQMTTGFNTEHLDAEFSVVSVR